MGKAGKGTGSFGRRARRKTHALCPRCGSRSYHKQKHQCGGCNYPYAKMKKFNWGKKAIRRRTTGTGRMRYLKKLPMLHRSGFKSIYDRPEKKAQAVKATA